jgi:hypothetical protein
MGKSTLARRSSPSLLNSHHMAHTEHPAIKGTSMAAGLVADGSPKLGAKKDQLLNHNCIRHRSSVIGGGTNDFDIVPTSCPGPTRSLAHHSRDYSCSSFDRP